MFSLSYRICASKSALDWKTQAAYPGEVFQPELSISRVVSWVILRPVNLPYLANILEIGCGKFNAGRVNSGGLLHRQLTTVANPTRPADPNSTSYCLDFAVVEWPPILADTPLDKGGNLKPTHKPIVNALR
jgi:hypothetical protein